MLPIPFGFGTSPGGDTVSLLDCTDSALPPVGCLQSLPRPPSSRKDIFGEILKSCPRALVDQNLHKTTVLARPGGDTVSIFHPIPSQRLASGQHRNRPRAIGPQVGKHMKSCPRPGGCRNLNGNLPYYPYILPLYIGGLGRWGARALGC